MKLSLHVATTVGSSARKPSMDRARLRVSIHNSRYLWLTGADSAATGSLPHCSGDCTVSIAWHGKVIGISISYIIPGFIGQKGAWQELQWLG